MKYIVGQVEGVPQPTRLGVFDTEEQASAFITTLPNAQDGRYYLDEVDDETWDEIVWEGF